MSNPNNYPWIKNSFEIDPTITNRLAITSPSGLYFSTSSNSSILAPSNANLSITTAGTGDILLQTAGSTRVTIDDTGNMTSAKNITITDGVLTINNTTGGGITDPVFVLNQGINSAILYQEINNSRNPTNLSSLYQVSYKGKNSANSSTIEYATMSVIPVSIGTTAASSKIDFKVSNTSAYVLELESNNSVFTSNLSMSNKSVNGIAALNYTTGNFVAPDYVINMDGSNDPFPLGFGNNNSTRILCKNIGLASSITNLPSSQQPPNGGSVYCSETFNSSIWIGTNNYIYYSSDNGATWNTLNDSNGIAYNFNGAITCMKSYPGYNFLIIGGQFTYATASSVSIPLNYIAIIDTNYSLSSMSWAQYSTSIGYNGYVMAIEYYNGYLYVGGNFTEDNSSGNFVNCYYFSIIEYNGSGTFGPGFYLYAINNSSGTGTNGYVNSIIYDTTTSNGYLIVGGSFTSISDNINNPPNPTTCNGAFFIGMNGPNVTTQPLAIDFMTGDVKSMIIIGSSIYVVGSFTNINSYNYFATLTWNTGTGNYDVGPNPYSSSYTPTGDINFIGANYTNNTIYWGENFSPYKLYSNGNFIADSPSNQQWLSVIYLTGTAANGICFCPNGAPSTFYYLLSEVLTLDSGAYIIVNNGQEYGPNAIITFPTKGTSILLEYNINNKLSVISNNGCTGIGLSSGSGGISTISAGSGISVSSPTGPTSTIYNTGVTSISAGTGISINQSTGAVTITNTGSPAGTNQFITTIDTTTLPLIPADQTLNLVNAGVPASGKFSGAWTGQTLPVGEIVNASAIKVLFQLPTYTTPNGVYAIIGCESGKVYYTDGINPWTLAFTANARIRTMWADNRTDGTGRFVFFGGDMTSVSGGIFGPPTTVNYMFAWDLNFTSFPAVPGAGIIPAWANRSGQTGFNGPVYSIVQMRGNNLAEYTPNNLLVGGAFTGTNTGGYSCLRIATIVMTYPGPATTTYNLFAPDNNNGGSTGFNALVRDISSFNGANVIVGDFLTFTYNSNAGLTTQTNNYAVNWTTSSTGYNSISAPKLIGATGTSLNAPMYSVDFTQDIGAGGSNAGVFILGGDATGVPSNINPSIPTIDRVFGYMSILPPGSLIPYDSTGTFFTAPVRLVEQSPDVLTAPARSSYVSDTSGRLFKLSGGFFPSSATNPELITTLTGGEYITSASVMPSGFTFSGSFSATTLYGFGTTRSDTIFSQSQTATTTPLLLNTSGNFVFVSVPASTTLELPTADGTQIIIGGASSSRIELKQRGSVIQMIYNSATSRFYVSNWISANVAVLDANIYAP